MSNAADENTQAIQGLTGVLKQVIQGPPNPPAGLPAILADRARVRALTEAARLGGFLPVQLYLLAAGRGAPSARTAAEFVAACVRSGWRAIPAGLELPRPGDLFILTGETRQPEQVGIVGPLDAGGEFFVGLLDGERVRRGMREADFWLRVPGG